MLRQFRRAPAIRSVRGFATEQPPTSPGMASRFPGIAVRPTQPANGSSSTPQSAKALKRERLQTRQRVRRHLRQLMPQFEAMGSQRTTAMLKPSMMLDHEGSNLTLETMMAAGMHLGHSTSLWNPMNLPYIFGERQGVHIINLEHTMAALRRAAQFVHKVAYNGGLVLFVGTRKDHQQMAVDAALHSDQFYIMGKWIPGTLTNPKPLLARHALYAEDVWDVEEAQEFADYVSRAAQPKETGNTRYMKMVKEEKERLEKENVDVKTYKPDLIVALNPLECKTMLVESQLAYVSTIGIVDTNCNPGSVTYSIPCNDDSVRAVSIVAGVLARAARDGKDLRRQQMLDAVDKHNTDNSTQ